MPKTVRHPNLLQYWSIRYFLNISISIAIIIIASLSIIVLIANGNQTRSLAAMAYDIALMVDDHGGSLPQSPSLQNTLEDMVNKHGLNGRPILFITDSRGNILQQQPSTPPDGIAEIAAMLDVAPGSAQIREVKSPAAQLRYLAAVQPTATGWVFYFEQKQTRLKEIFYNSPRFTLLGTFLLIGWTVVYAMTRRLVKPVREVAEAARKVVEGNYGIRVNTQYKEAEIYELTHSFNEMTERLARLHSLRTHLLMGITNELKTPVVSIHQMVQAVRNREVQGDEAHACLEDALAASNQLHNRIENLFEFNRLITSGISVTRVSCDLGALAVEAIGRWTLAQHGSKVNIVHHIAGSRGSREVWTDPVRVEQVLINLLNNAKAAMPPEGTATVLLAYTADQAHLQVHDTGRGILSEEHDAIFEPFYSGSANAASGQELGIGLPSSRLIARSLGGDLVLSDSRPGSTTFTLILPLDHPAS